MAYLNNSTFNSNIVTTLGSCMCWLVALVVFVVVVEVVVEDVIAEVASLALAVDGGDVDR